MKHCEVSKAPHTLRSDLADWVAKAKVYLNPCHIKQNDLAF
ncbi:hypothetical protein [Campylobacter troglodytis]|nr:hypothetical protein [Campylobacter troglodytis]